MNRIFSRPLPWPGRRGPTPTAWIALGLGAVVALVFARTLACGFVNYDDGWFVHGNERVEQGLTWANLVWALTTQEMGYPKPVTILSWMLDSELFGTGPAGYHATNALLHAANAAILFLAIRSMTGRIVPSLIVAAIWALHPLRVESVAWISQRKDVLSGFFGFLALWAYARYARRRGAHQLLASAGLLALSLMSKPTLVTFPALLLLLDIWPLKRISGPLWGGSAPEREPLGRVIAEKIPFFLIAAGMAAWVLGTRVSHRGRFGGLGFPLEERVANAGVSLVRYLGKHLFVDDLALVYPVREWSLAITLICFGFLLTLGVLVLGVARRRPGIAVGWLWFLIALGPMLRLNGINNFAMGDRYTYVPSVGLLLAAVFALPWLAGGRRGRRAAAVSALAVAAALAACTVLQIGFWRDSGTLFRHTIAETGRNPLAMANLAAHLRDEGRLYEAHTWLLIEPEGLHLVKARKIRAGVRYELGHRLAAVADLRAFVAKKPDDAGAWRRIGRIYRELGLHGRAIASLERAVRTVPDAAAGWGELGRALGEGGRPGDALLALDRAGARDPDRGDVHSDRAKALEDLGRPRLAGWAYARGARFAPKHPGLRLNQGIFLLNRGFPRRAVEPLETAIAHAEEDATRARAHRNLGRCYDRIGDPHGALRHWRRAVSLVPDHARARNQLGVLLGRAGRIEAAIRHFRRAVELDPELREARHNLEAARKMRAGSR